jgi:hypothetical protein
VAVADLVDGDGRLDIAACHDDLGLFVYFNAGKGNFGRGLEIAGRDALLYSMIATDLNRDGTGDHSKVRTGSRSCLFQ